MSARIEACTASLTIGNVRGGVGGCTTARISRHLTAVPFRFWLPEQPGRWSSRPPRKAAVLLASPPPRNGPKVRGYRDSSPFTTFSSRSRSRPLRCRRLCLRTVRASRSIESESRVSPHSWQEPGAFYNMTLPSLRTSRCWPVRSKNASTSGRGFSRNSDRSTNSHTSADLISTASKAVCASA
jgi:hypothetical protein